MTDLTIEWYPFDYLQRAVFAAKGGEWSWTKNTRCKYIDVRIDMRFGKFTLRDRDGKPITITELEYQYTSEYREEIEK